MASDGAATSHTIHQESKKLSIIEGSVVAGVSGPVGLGQRLVGELRHFCENQKHVDKHPITVMTELTNIFRTHIISEASMAQQVLSIDPHARQSWVSSTVVAIPLAGVNHLICFDHLGAPTVCTLHLPFVAVGSGQLAGDPFLAFVRKLLWADSLPSLTLGIFSAVWTLQHAIRTSPGGVSEPIQVMISTEKDGSITARELQDTEWGPHLEAVDSLEKNIPKKALTLPPPPTPPPPPPTG